MSEELYTPQEVAELLKIKKSTVYELIKRGELKCRKVGKQFRIRKDDLDQYINSTGEISSYEITQSKELANTSKISLANVEKITFLESNSQQSQPPPSYPINVTNKGIVLCGQDILLEVLCNYLSRILKNTPIYRSYQGSYNGLYALYQDEVDVATVHLLDGETGEYNKEYVKRMLPGTKHVRVHLVDRWQGFYVQKGNPKNIVDFKDFLRSDVRMINREKGSGTRILFDEMLIKLGLDRSKIMGYDREVNSHLACAGAVSRLSADVSLGIERISKEMAGVDFIPIQKESYDLVVKAQHLQSDWFQKLIQILNSTDYREEIMGMSGYDITDMGKIMS